VAGQRAGRHAFGLELSGLELSGEQARRPGLRHERRAGDPRDGAGEHRLELAGLLDQALTGQDIEVAQRGGAGGLSAAGW
jgi:hypothetical protein